MPDIEGTEVVPHKAHVQLVLTGSPSAILEALETIRRLEDTYFGLDVMATIKVEEIRVTTELVGKMREILEMSIEDLLDLKHEGREFPQLLRTRTAACLRNQSGINTVGELMKYRATFLLNTTSLDAGSVEFIQAQLAAFGLELEL